MQATIAIDVNNLPEELAKAADRFGVYPKHIANDHHTLSLAGFNPEDITEDVVAKAERVFRSALNNLWLRVDRFNGRVATVANEPSFVAIPKHPKERKPVTPTRAKIFGYSVTAVLRWMGAEGWNFDAAYTAVTNLTEAYSLSDITIRVQLNAGKKGERGPAAPITPSQAKTLRNASK